MTRLSNVDMSDMVTLTKVNSMTDWEGIYFDGKVRYQSHTAEITDIELDDEEAIESIDLRIIDMSKLGITALPDDLDVLDDKVEFRNAVVEDKSTWAERIKEAINSFDGPVSSDEMISELGITEEEFDVIEGCFMPDGVFNNSTALGEKAILAKAENDGQLTPKYTLMQNDNARSYK